jgi:hypothetical protein
MKNAVAVMQPYVFPYLGYFCLIEASDVFVFYDDVNFIQRGWINRNQILINGEPHRFTIPLTNGSQNELIKNVRTHALDAFKEKFLKQLSFAYKRAPFFDVGMHYVEDVFSSNNELIADLAIHSVAHFYHLLGMKKDFLSSSLVCPESKGLDKADRLIDITKKLGGSAYLNAVGGMNLYEKNYFNERGVGLSFVKPRMLEYRQNGVGCFIPGLSVIDAVMNCTIPELKIMIERFDLI